MPCKTDDCPECLLERRLCVPPPDRRSGPSPEVRKMLDDRAAALRKARGTGCPKCGSRMFRVKGRDGGAPYMRCETFPKCPGSRSLVRKSAAPQGEKPVLSAAPPDPKACVDCGDSADRLCAGCHRRVCGPCRDGHECEEA